MIDSPVSATADDVDHLAGSSGLEPVNVVKPLEELIKDASNALKQYDEGNDPADLARALSLTDHFAWLSPSTYKQHQYRAASNTRARVLIRRFALSSNTVDLDAALKLHGEALEVSTASYEGDPAETLHALAMTLAKRADRGLHDDLKDAFIYAQQALTLAPAATNAALWVTRSSELAQSLRKWVNHQWRVTNIHAAIKHNNFILPSFPPTSSERIEILNHLSHDYHALFQVEGRVADLETAINFRRHMLVLCPPGHKEHPSCVFALGALLKARNKEEPDEGILNEAIICFEQTTEFETMSTEEKLFARSDLASCLRTRYETKSRPEDLDLAVTQQREVRRLCANDNTFYPTTLNNLGLVLKIKFEARSNLEDLEESIKLQQEALDSRKPGQSNRQFSLHNLASSLQDRFEYLGDTKDLEEAIGHYREALSLRPPGQKNRHTTLNSLATLLCAKYRITGERSWLEESITLQEESLAARKAGSVDSTYSLTNLGVALLARFEADGDVGDLEEAMEYHRSSVDLRPEGHHAKPTGLTHFANALLVQHKELVAKSTMEYAVHYHRDASQLYPLGHWKRGAGLSGLGRALQVRFERVGDDGDLDEAIEYHLEALKTTPAGHIDHQDVLISAAAALHARYKHSGQPADLEDAMKYYRQVLAQPQQLRRSSITKAMLEGLSDALGQGTAHGSSAS